MCKVGKVEFSTFYVPLQHKPGIVRLVLRFLDHIQLNTHNRYDSSERVISSSQRPLSKQQTEQNNIHALSWIQKLQTYALNRTATGIGKLSI
jgi:hypothetical protein